MYYFIPFLFIALCLTSCGSNPHVASPGGHPASAPPAEIAVTAAELQTKEAGTSPPLKPGSPTKANYSEKVVLGTGVFVQPVKARPRQAYATEDGITLNFEQAALPEFLHVVLETILQDSSQITSIRASILNIFT